MRKNIFAYLKTSAPKTCSRIRTCNILRTLYVHIIIISFIFFMYSFFECAIRWKQTEMYTQLEQASTLFARTTKQRKQKKKKKKKKQNGMRNIEKYGQCNCYNMKMIIMEISRMFRMKQQKITNKETDSIYKWHTHCVSTPLCSALLWRTHTASNTVFHCHSHHRPIFFLGFLVIITLNIHIFCTIS